MLRRAFLKRMALAAAACAFIDVPWPKAQAFTATEALERYRQWSTQPLPTPALTPEMLADAINAMVERSVRHRGGWP